MSTSNLQVATRPAASSPPASPSAAPGLGLRLAGALREAGERATAFALLLLASPVLAVVAAAVKLTSPGPVLFAQDRIGRDGERFRMLKFRSMVSDAESQEEALAGSAGPGPFFKVRQDRRITPIGHFLRRSSLDEVPQLWNVVRGEMRLVGPRPLLVREHRALPSRVQQWRSRVKPGLTGLWQVSGRSRTTPATRLRLDRLYVERAGLGLDFRILARTPKAVLEADGAV